MVVDDLRQQLVQRDALGTCGQARRITRQHQQQLDQLFHALCRAQDPLHLLAGTFWQAGLLQRQLGRTSDMVRSVEELIVHITEAMTLLPGDVILTGTPAGVGPLTVGDEVAVSIEGIGTLTNKVIKRG